MKKIDLSLADSPESLMDLADDELSLVLTEVLSSAEYEECSDEQIVEAMTLLEAKWFEAGDKPAPHPLEVLARKMEHRLGLN